MDPHRKGFLTFRDWEYLFSNYILIFIIENIDQKNFSLIDIKSAIASSFMTLSEAFDYMSKRSQSSESQTNEMRAINLPGFNLVIDELLPKRFSKVQISGIWS